MGCLVTSRGRACVGALLVAGALGACARSSPVAGSAVAAESMPAPTTASGAATPLTARGMTGAGWAVLPSPPGSREYSAFVAAGDVLLDWGGRVEGEKGCSPEGAQTVPGRDWYPLPTAPEGLCGAEAVWTGHEAIFWTPKMALAFDPGSGSWRTLPPAPTGANGSVLVWTGKEMIVWGGGERGAKSTFAGSAYDPRRDRWRRIADAPIGLNLASGVWTGKQMIVFGSLLNGGNHAATRSAVGAAYDTRRDAWRSMPKSQLSPQATSAAWADGELVAWDYETKSQEFSTKTWTWGRPERMPLHFSECYPDSTVVSGQVFAWFCGQAALYDGGKWSKVAGGPLDVMVASGKSEINLFRFAQLASAGKALYVQTEGVTVNANGIPCYGCGGAPVAYWVLRPGPLDAECLNTGAHDMYHPVVSPDEAPAGRSFTILGNVPVRSQDGTYRGPDGRIDFWWDLDPEAWVSAVGNGTPSPSGPAPATRLGTVDVSGRCTFGATFAIPADALPGRHPVVPISHSGRSSSSFASVHVTVSPPA